MDDISARKERSEARLQAMGVSVSDDMPMSSHPPHMRSPREVAERAMILFVVARRGGALLAIPDTFEQRRTYRGTIMVVWMNDLDWPENEDGLDAGIDFLQRRGLWDAVSPREKQFFLDPQPDRQVLNEAAWKDECAHVLLWSLGHVAELGPPTEPQEDVTTTRTLLLADSDILTDATLRPEAEILDELDFIRRCRWAVYQARTGGSSPPAAINDEVAWERHHALQWIAGIREQDWDDVTLTT